LKKADQVLKKGLIQKMFDLGTEFQEIICKASRSKRLYQISQMLREHNDEIPGGVGMKIMFAGAGAIGAFGRSPGKYFTRDVTRSQSLV
jgi:hypothetical protein